MSNNTTSRRYFALGAGIAAAAGVASKASAQSTTPVGAADVGVLNYALALEHLEATFYTQGLQRFSAADFSNATFARILGSGTAAGVYTNLGRIRDHEVAHVEALQAAVRAGGGTPVAACTYNFRYNTPDQFLQVAAVLEETGVQAYNGAIASVQSAQLRAAGAGIATVEGRHSAYLNLVNSAIPFPRAFDEAKMMRDILAAVAAYTVSCPATGDGGTPTPGQTMAMLLPKNFSSVNREVALDVSQSVSGNGQPLTYQVRTISGPASVRGANTDRPIAQLNGNGFSEYVFELTVTDSAGNTSTDRTTIRYVGV